jgi:pentatricopeptide repeat protein
MEKTGVAGNAIIFGALIDLALKVNQEQKAEDLFTEMENLGIEHTIVSISLKIKMYGRLQRPDMAMKTLRSIKETKLEPGILTFNSVIDSVARTGSTGWFPEILRLIRDYNQVPNACTFGIIAKGED